MHVHMPFKASGSSNPLHGEASQNQDILEKAKQFEASRRTLEEEWFEKYVRVSLISFAFGLGTVTLAFFLLAFYVTDPFGTVGLIIISLKAIGSVLMFLGIIGASICPFKEGEYEREGYDGSSTVVLSWDESMQKHPNGWLASVLFAGLLSASEIFYLKYPYTQCLAIFPALYAVLVHPCGLVLDEKKGHRPRPSTICIWWLVLTLGGWGPVEWSEQHEQLIQGRTKGTWPTVERNGYKASCILRLVSAFLAVLAWLYKRHDSRAWNEHDEKWKRKRKGAAKAKRHEVQTISLFAMITFHLVITGMSSIIIGASSLRAVDDIDDDENKGGKQKSTR